jgi:type IV secretory pathway TrbL component
MVDKLSHTLVSGSCESCVAERYGVEGGGSVAELVGLVLVKVALLNRALLLLLLLLLVVVVVLVLLLREAVLLVVGEEVVRGGVALVLLRALRLVLLDRDRF